MDALRRFAPLPALAIALALCRGLRPAPAPVPGFDTEAGRPYGVYRVARVLDGGAVLLAASPTAVPVPVYLRGLGPAADAAACRRLRELVEGREVTVSGSDAAPPGPEPPRVWLRRLEDGLEVDDAMRDAELSPGPGG